MEFLIILGFDRGAGGLNCVKSSLTIIFISELRLDNVDNVTYLLIFVGPYLSILD